MNILVTGAAGFTLPLAATKSRKRVGLHRPRAKWYYTYVLLSIRDAKRYIGWTEDLEHRFKMHQEGKVSATHTRRPFELEYYEACHSKIMAIRRERYFKTGFGRKFLKERLARSRGGRVGSKGFPKPMAVL